NACSATMSAYWVNGSQRLMSLFSRYSAGSKSFSSQANLVLNLDASNLVMGAAPLFPAISPSQNACTSLPIGVSAPIPVTTTLFINIKNQFYFLITIARTLLLL